MRTIKKKLLYFSYYLLSIASLFLALFVFFDRYNIIFNSTESYPIGFYQKKVIHRDIQRGDLVMFCLPNDALSRLIQDRGYLARGSCDSGLTPLLKRVYAVAGDEVKINVNGVNVNSADIIKNSMPIGHDIQGRDLPLMESGVIAEGYHAVFSAHHPRSFDSRYFGAVNRESIFYFVEPFWVMGER
jgi:conjugative transfer signal peptidase TraF